MLSVWLTQPDPQGSCSCMLSFHSGALQKKPCSQFKNFGIASAIKIWVCETIRTVMSNHVFTRYFCMHQAICSDKLFSTYLWIQSKGLWSFLFIILSHFSLACWHLQGKLVTTVESLYCKHEIFATPLPTDKVRGVQDQLSCLCPAHLEGNSEEPKQQPLWEWGRSWSQCSEELWTSGRHFPSGAAPHKDESQRSVSGHPLPLVSTLW